jgi:hypothetical protein
MTNRPLPAITPAGLRRGTGIIGKIPESIDAGERHFSVSGIKKPSEFAMFCLAASSCWPASSAIVNFEKRQSRNKSVVSNGYWRCRFTCKCAAFASVRRKFGRIWQRF